MKTAKFPTRIKGKNKPKYEKKTKRTGEICAEKADNSNIISIIAFSV
jgi:hypothetical protein